MSSKIPDCVEVPSATWWFTTVLKSSYSGSIALVWPPQALYICAKQNKKETIASSGHRASLSRGKTMDTQSLYKNQLKLYWRFKCKT